MIRYMGIYYRFKVCAPSYKRKKTQLFGSDSLTVPKLPFFSIKCEFALYQINLLYHLSAFI